MRQGPDTVFVLPIAATEQHGPHLPATTDVDICEGILASALARIPADELPLELLPTVEVGASLEHAHLPGTVSRSAGEMRSEIVRIGRSVTEAGGRRLVVFNAHGGNRAALDDAALELRARDDLLVVKASWFRFPRPNLGIPESEWATGLHGGRVETSMMLHLHPDRVRRGSVRDFRSLDAELAGSLRHLRAEGVAPFAWLADDLNPDGVTGDAAAASAEEGAALVDHYGRVLAEILRDAADFPLDRLAGGRR